MALIKVVLLLVLSCSVCVASSQAFSKKSVSKDYFRNPVGLPMEIVANMGELRPNHWHMGLDIRTNQKENQPVLAAADGFISHIGIRPQSFGRFIIIDHPNGLSTLYAHLNDFFPALEEYVTSEQYRKESWAIELDIDRNKFPVKQGQFIANSGNTGGSQGPHLHFEIIDTKSGKRLNPLLFNFPLEDDVRPTIVKLAMYDRTQSVYTQTPQFFAAKNTDSGYILPKNPVIITGLNKISFAIQAYDRIKGSSNADGIYSAQLFLDDEPISKFVIDSISYEETGFMNSHIDYRYRYNGGPYLQHLSKMAGDQSQVYKPFLDDGIIYLDDTTVHEVSIELRDAYNNISTLDFRIQYSDSLGAMRQKVPRQVFTPEQVNVLEREDFEMYAQEGCFYDSVPIQYFKTPNSKENAVSAAHQLGDASIPVHREMNIRIKSTVRIPEDRKDKIVIRRAARNTQTRKAEVQGDWISAKFDDFGVFQAFVDTEPPTINNLGNADTVNLSPVSRILFTPSDNFAVKSFRAELNGEWLRFTNDKGRNWIYVFDERVPYGTYKLEVTVVDLVGNSTTKSWWFKRGPYTPPKKKFVSKKSKKKSSGKKTAAKKKKSTKRK